MALAGIALAAVGIVAYAVYRHGGRGATK